MKFKWILRTSTGEIAAGWSSLAEVILLLEGLAADEELDVLASPKG